MDPHSRPMHFPDTEPSINITESLAKQYMKKNDVPRFEGEIGLENLCKWLCTKASAHTEN
jgi:hypothetical protein